MVEPLVTARPVLDTQRHDSVFSAADFKRLGHRVTLLGAGPIASRLGRHLSQLGVPFSVFSPEQVSCDHLTAYGTPHWNRSQASALQAIAERDTGTAVQAFSRELSSEDELGRIVFIADSDERTRQALLDRFEFGPAGVDTVFDVAPNCITRIEPRWRRELKLYRKQIEQVPHTRPLTPLHAEYAASVAAFQLIRWFSNWRELSGGCVPEEYLPNRLPLNFTASEAELSRVEQFPQEFRASGMSISVIGGGALGSRVARHLAEFGLPFTVHDFDRVEGHNLPNQAFGFAEIGEFKAEAIAEIAVRDFGFGKNDRPIVTPCLEKFDGTQRLNEIVFVCPDNMLCRKQVWDSVRFSQQCSLVVEGRLGEFWGKLYTACPRTPAHLREYGKTLLHGVVAAEPAPEAAVPRVEAPRQGACQISTTVGPTAECIASRMVWQFVRWFSGTKETRSQLDHEIFEYLYPVELYCRTFR